MPAACAAPPSRIPRCATRASRASPYRPPSGPALPCGIPPPPRESVSLRRSAPRHRDAPQWPTRPRSSSWLSISRLQFLQQLFRLHTVLEGLHPVDRDHRHLVVVPAPQLLIAIDVYFFVVEIRAPARRLDHPFGLLAQVAARPRVQGDPWFHLPAKIAPPPVALARAHGLH